MKRRKFLQQSAALGAMTCIGGSFLSSCGKYGNYDLAVFNSRDYYAATVEAMNFIGGMSKHIGRTSKVGLLINSDFEHKGAYVNPDISLAVIKMMFDAGASRITLLQTVKEEYWKRSALYESHREMIGALDVVASNTFPSTFNEDDWVLINEIPGAIALKEAEVARKALECDVFVNIPISKHHATTLLTGALKNMMGITTRKTNVTYHLGSGKRNDPDYLAQCIADINLFRKTDLCIMDSTEFITTNGPSGPGDIVKENIVIAGTDIVAIDTIASEYLGYYPEEILTSVKGEELGVGTMKKETLKIKEITV